MTYCEHGQNKQACLKCFNIAQRAPKVPQRNAQSNEPNQGQVVRVNVAENPHAAALMARKAAAYDAMSSKLPPTGTNHASAAAVGSVTATPQAPRSRVASAPVADEDGEGDETLSAADIASLASLYPKRPEMIDQKTTHPDSPQPQPQGRGAGGGASRPIITKGTPRSSS